MASNAGRAGGTSPEEADNEQHQENDKTDFGD